MAKSWTFRITSEGLKELERDLGQLGAQGQRIFDGLKQQAPGLADALKGAETQLGRTRRSLTEVAKESSASAKAMRIAGDEAGRYGEAMASRLGPVGTILGRIGPAGLAAAAGIGAVVTVMTKAVMAAEEAERSQRRLESVLRATGHAAGLTGREIDVISKRLESRTLFGGEQIRQASIQLSTFRSVSGDTFRRVIAAATDLATVFGTDLNSAVMKLGVALEDPIRGYDDLRKMGVSLTTTQRDLIVELVKSGDLVKAQGIILDEVQKRVGGAAEADQTGLTGSINRLSDSWNQFLEKLGNSFGVLDGITAVFDRLIGKSERLAELMVLTLPGGPALVAAATPAASLESQLETLQGKLAALEKGSAGSDPTSPSGVVDQMVIDSLKQQIADLEELIRFRRLAGEAAAEQVQKAGELASAEAAAAAAAAANAEALKRQTELRAQASKQLDDFLSRLEFESETLGMSAIERERQNSLLELEKIVKTGLIDIDDKRIAQARTTIDLTAKQSEAWENLLGFMATMESQQKADEQRQKDWQKTVEKIAKDQERIAERQAEMMMEPFKNALEGIQRSFADFFYNVYDQGIDSFASLGDSITQIFRRVAAEITALMVFRPVLVGGLNALGMGNLAAQFGLGGAGSLTGLPGLGGSLIGSGAGTGTGTVSGSGFGLSNIFGGLGLLGNGSSGIGTMLFGAPAITGPYGSTIGAATQGLFGSSGGGQFGALLNTPLGGGFAAGLGSLALSAVMSGGKISTGSLVSAGLAGIGTALGGPIGGVIGGLVGSLVGGLFGKKPKWKKTKLQSGAILGFDDLGMIGVQDTYSIAKRTDPNTQIGQKLGEQASDTFNEYFLGLGAEFDPSLEGDVRYLYRIKKKGKKKKGERESWAAWFGGEHLGTTQNADELMPIFLSGALAVAAEQGKVTGVSETLQTIFKTVFNENNRQGITDADELTRMVDFGTFYDRVDEIRSPAQAATEALRELNKAMAQAKATAEEFGLSVDRIDTVFRDNFLEDVRDELLALKDPEALALRELEKERAARLAVAEKLGVGIAEVEELYGLRRLQIIEQGLSSVGRSFRDFFDSLLYGDISAVAPETQLATARAEYESAVAAGDKGRFLPAAEQYLALMREFHASTAPYVEAFRSVLENTRLLGGLDVDIPHFAGGGLHEGGLAMAGERGKELLLTGPARFIDNVTTERLLAGADSRVAEMLAQARSAELLRLDGRREGEAPVQRGLAATAATGSLERHIGNLGREIGQMRRELGDVMSRLAMATEMSGLAARYQRN